MASDLKKTTGRVFNFDSGVRRIAPELNVKHLDSFIQKKFLALQTKLSQGAETPFGARQGSASQVPFSSIVHSRDLVY